jgi:hypothetical protein
MCDMNGTFALRSEADITWDPVTLPPPFNTITVLAGGADTTVSWQLRHHTVNGNTMQIDSIPCGGTSPDLCSPFLQEAYAQIIPDTIWDGSAIPVTSTPMTLTDPDPGDPFNGPSEVDFIGLSLATPNGAWPATWDAAGITWLDPDSDGQPGLTSIARGSGTSAACGFPYAFLPDQSNSNGPRIERVFSGSRGTGKFTGTIKDCNTITGNVGGPDNGFAKLEGRVRGCRYANGQACTASTVNSLDSSASTSNLHIQSSTFVMVRVPSTTTCAQVRAMTFPPQP